MDEMIWRNVRRTSSLVVVVLTQLSFVHLHTWQTRHGGRDFPHKEWG
jgi:hypothetical protein